MVSLVWSGSRGAATSVFTCPNSTQTSRAETADVQYKRGVSGGRHGA